MRRFFSSLITLVMTGSLLIPAVALADSSESSVSSSVASTSAVSSVSSASSVSSTSSVSWKTSSKRSYKSESKRSKNMPIPIRGLKKLDGTCMSAAVTKRDTAIATALKVVVSAIEKRGADLATAWAKTDVQERKAAVKDAEKAFKGSWNTFQKSREAAWKQYRTDAKACKTSPADMGEQNEESGEM